MNWQIDSKGIDNGWEYDRLTNPEAGDFYNFMNSGRIYENNTTHDINKYRMRKYQWTYIRDGK